jgi:hypothetical protein
MAEDAAEEGEVEPAVTLAVAELKRGGWWGVGV